MIAIICISLVMVINLHRYLHARHQRRLAEARLEITKVITEMERCMLRTEHKLTVGDIFHDVLYPQMVQMQYVRKFKVPWKFWARPSNFKEIRERLVPEITNETPLGKLFSAYSRASFKAFKNNRPFASLLFLGWVLMFAGGLGVLCICVLSLLGVVKATIGFTEFASQIYLACLGDGNEWVVSRRCST